MNCEKIVNKVNKANRINSIHRVYKETSKLINPEQQTELPSADYPTPAQAVAREVGNLGSIKALAFNMANRQPAFGTFMQTDPYWAIQVVKTVE